MSQNQIKIESIKKLKRPGFYSLITSEETISITDDIIVKYALTKDLILTEEEFEKLKKDNEKNNFYLKACHYIYYQMRSLREVEEYLRKYQINEDYLNEIIERLKSLQIRLEQFRDEDKFCFDYLRLRPLTFQT